MWMQNDHHDARGTWLLAQPAAMCVNNYMASTASSIHWQHQN
jgi:hypothetical protein